MKRKFVIDTSVFINFSRYNKVHRLITAIAKNIPIIVAGFTGRPLQLADANFLRSKCNKDRMHKQVGF